MNTSKLNAKQFGFPAVLCGALILGGGMFWLGRNQTPSSTLPTAQEKRDDDDHGEEDPHGEEGHDDHNEETIRFSPEALRSAGIELATVGLQPQISGLPFNGSIEPSPNRIARVGSAVSGRITQLSGVVGTKVEKGQVLALLESRSIGEAQSAFKQAAARLQNASSRYEVVQRQAKAGVFSQTPLEAARRARNDAVAQVRTTETQLQQAQTTLENTVSLARSGSYASPSLEAARGAYAAASEQFKSASAEVEEAQAQIRSAGAQLARRRQVAASGGYALRPLEEAKQVLVAAQSAKATAQSEVSTTRTNLSRAKSLSAEGLISTRDFENAQNAFEAAQARLEAASSGEQTANREFERQQKLAASGVATQAEVREVEAALTAAQSRATSKRAQLQRTRESLRLAETALKRERSIFEAGVANRRELVAARAVVANSRTAAAKARQDLKLADAALRRESTIFKSNLNNKAQLEEARSNLVLAQAEMNAAQTTLQLLRTSPRGSATLPLRSPINGVIQARDVTEGESVEAERNLFTVANLDIVHVDMFIPEREISRVRIGSAVQIRVDASPGRTFNGTIELIHPELDPKTRTVEAHAEIPNPGGLRPGMFARGFIYVGQSTPTLSVPTDAVQELEGKKVVFISRDKAGDFTAREVSTGATSDGKTVIRSGLRPGERIVVKGAFMVKAQAMKAELGHEH